LVFLCFTPQDYRHFVSVTIYATKPSCEPDDVALKTVTVLGFEDVLMWASDYPHFDCTFPGVVEELQEACVELPEDVQDKIMGENAARCYGLA